ncbi:MAG: hypothetical protein JNK27_06085 [Chitinophagaceae bacterium]|nr:hypothetical protein [Chitinophagaceae bacterium]
MKKKHSLLLCVQVFTLFQCAQAQDHVITWDADTLTCIFPDKPRKEGLRPGSKYENGHIRLLAHFENDSVRIIEAGDVKGYSRKKHGKSLLCDGVFESVELTEEEQRYIYYGRSDGKRWYFLNRVFSGKYASLYVMYISRTSESPRSFYFIKKTDQKSTKPVLLRNWKQIFTQLDDLPVNSGFKADNYRGKKRNFVYVVNDYNRLKEL